MAKKLTYESASKELEEIRDALESNDVSIDKLSEKVKRAHELILFCREKLRSTEDDLAKIVEQ